MRGLLSTKLRSGTGIEVGWGKARFSMENSNILGKVGIGFRKTGALDGNLSYSYVYNPLWVGLVTVC